MKRRPRGSPALLVNTLKLETRNLKPGRWLYVDLPLIEYQHAWDMQGRLVTGRKEDIINTDVLLFLEHPPVFTLGHRGGMKNLSVSRDFLEKRGIPVIKVERGGDITFHGPGQLVVYPIINLRKARIKVIDYVTNLEEVMIRAAADWGIAAERNTMNRGVWVGNNKLGSIGIAIRRGISFHGLAFNVNLSLEPFEWIHPCGLQGIGMTSMERELSRKIPMDQVRDATRSHIEKVFGVELAVTDLEELKIDY